MIRKEYQKLNNSEFIELKFFDEFKLRKNVLQVSGLSEIARDLTLFFYKFFESYNVQTCFFTESEDKKLLLKNFDEVKIKIKVYNNSGKELSDYFGLEKFERLNSPIFEFYHLGVPDFPMNEHHLLALKLLSLDDAKNLIRQASKINVVLKSFFQRRELEVAELNIEFGKVDDKYLLLGSFLPEDLVLITDSSNNSKERKVKFSITNKNIKDVYSNYKNLVFNAI